jgi:uncharacterized cupredoxin-like copper-binding protein
VIRTAPITIRAIAGTLAGIAAAVALAACGSSGSSSSDKGPASTPPASSGSTGYGSSAPSGGGGTTAPGALKLAADEGGGLYFNKKNLTAKAGKVTIVMNNPGSSGKPHGIAVEGQHVDKDGKVVSPGGTSTLQVTLKPGRYKFYCPVPGHEQAGMKGTLVVQ